MNTSRKIEYQPGMTLGDIYFVIFRHKWKIIILTLAGIAAAVAFYYFKPPPYQSQAELLIKYVPEANSFVVGSANQNVIVPGSSGDDIINSEIRILTSLNLAEETATNIGATNILAGAGGGDNPLAAAALIQSHLEAVPADRGSSVILVTFEHPDPRIVQPVLQEVINDYLQMHREIHQASGLDDDTLSREEADLKVQLDETENQLADVMNRANIVSLEDTKDNLASQISKIQNDILDAKTELSQYGIISRDNPKVDPSNVATNNTQPEVPADQITAYQDICTRLDYLQSKEQSYVVQGFTTENVLVKELSGQLADAQKAKEALEKKYPQLMKLANASTAADNASTTPLADDFTAQSQRIGALKAKITALNWQLDQFCSQATNLNTIAPLIVQLEQRKQILSTNIENLAVSLEQARINEALESGKTAPNISPIETPTPPFRDWKRTYEKMAGLAFGGLFLSLVWAFFMEVFLDRSIKRPIEVEAKLKMPLFLSIPEVNQHSRARLAQNAERRQLQWRKTANDEVPVVNGDSPATRNGAAVVSLEQNDSLKPFYEALRDRLIVYFEVGNLKHKPKLVAVTGVNPGAGVSSIAAGLAASLSETGDGNVLLVDMNIENGAAQHFYKGNACCGLDTVLKEETRNNALVQENLYVVTGNSNSQELSTVLPRRFAAVVPTLKASDYDYIIFDMPTVNQTSITPRLSRFMDMVLMVVESEKSSREVVQRANKLLVESGATVSAVLNKTRKYVPESIHQEYLSDA